MHRGTTSRRDTSPTGRRTSRSSRSPSSCRSTRRRRRCGRRRCWRPRASPRRGSRRSCCPCAAWNSTSRSTSCRPTSSTRCSNCPTHGFGPMSRWLPLEEPRLPPELLPRLPPLEEPPPLGALRPLLPPPLEPRRWAERPSAATKVSARATVRNRVVFMPLNSSIDVPSTKTLPDNGLQFSRRRYRSDRIRTVVLM